MKFLKAIISRLLFWRREANKVEVKNDGVRNEMGLVGYNDGAKEPIVKTDKDLMDHDDFVDELKKQWKV